MAQMEGLSEEDRRMMTDGIRAFNDGDFYGAHDHFEALWGEDVWKGLVQAAVALHHYDAENPEGFKGLPENVHRILDAYRPHYLGMDIERFVREFDGFFELVARGGNPSTKQAPKIRLLEADDARDRGRREGHDRH